MENWYEAPAILSALIAAFLGSLFGALFKEQLSDRFYKRKRKREIRASVSKEIITFIYILIQQVQIKNFAETLRIQKRILHNDREKVDDPQEHEKYTKEMFRVVDLMNEEAERDERLSLRVTETQANVHSLIVEATHYIKKINVGPLMSLLKEIQSERHSRKMLGELYQGDYLPELIAFRENELPKLVQQLILKKEERIEYYITSIHSLINV
jgi:hypothetical protein